MARRRKGSTRRDFTKSIMKAFWLWNWSRRWKMPIAYFLTLQQVAMPLAAAIGQNIRTDGRTQTTVTTQGAVTDITTKTVKNVNAFNSFTDFTVGQSNTVNLLLPTGTQNLINIVSEAPINVYGILNSIQDGKIGGNVYFADPYGFVVSRGGVVNVGSLGVSTPPQTFVNNFFTSPDNPDDGSVSQLLAGTAPRGSTGLVSIEGKVNAVNGIALSAGTINVGGTLYSGARFIGSAPDFTDVVNANGLASATKVVVNEGRIQIVADNDVDVSGTITAPGGAGIRGGTISINAGNDVNVNAGAKLSARGNGADSAGGTINVWGANNATFQAGAVIDASAGSSGNGGAIEFSAQKLVTLAGGQFKADAPGGKAGSVLVDPTDLSVTTDTFTGGTDLTLSASDAITVSNVYLSTRDVAPANENEANIASATSLGASGNLSLTAPTISVAGSNLLAFGNSGFTGGSINLNAAATGGSNASISVASSTLKGASVTLGANSSYTSTLNPVVVAGANASIDVESSSVQATAGDVQMNATSAFSASTPNVSPLATIAATSGASVNVGGTSALTASGNVTLAASSTVTASATPGTPNVATLPADAGVAINVITSSATTHVGGSTSVSAGGTLELDATNQVTANTVANASAGGATGLGGTLAVTELTTTTQAYLDGTATVNAAAVNLKANSANSLTTGATAATEGATRNADSQTQQYLTQYQGEASTSDGNVQVAAAVAIADVNSTTSAHLASTGQVTSMGALQVSSTALNASAVSADGSTATGTVGVGAAVGLNLGILSNQAYIADNSLIAANGLTLSAITPVSATDTFTTSVTSGAAATNVGVAGALGVNVLVNDTEAYVGDGSAGTTVNAGGGDVQIQAQNASSSSVTAGASLAGSGSGAKVGVGASVGLNVAVETTQARVGNSANLDGVGGMDLDATGTHALTTTVTGGAGATVAVTPTAAVSVAVDTTSALLGTGSSLTLGGAYSSQASQTDAVTTTATGQTQGSNVAVGASLALTTETDTVTATIGRSLTAGGAVSVAALSSSGSSASATASVAGGAPANSDGTSSTGQTVDSQVSSQGNAAESAGEAADPGAKGQLTAAQATPPKAQDSDGSVSVAAAVGVNVDVATTTAAIGEGLTVSSGGLLTLAGSNQTSGTAKADGSQTGTSSVGVGAAVALNLGVSTNTATIASGDAVTAQGVALSATEASGKTSSYDVEATSGAGAGKVGVAGSLAVNAVVNTAAATLQGADATNSQAPASVDAGGGDVSLTASSTTSSTVKADAKVTGSGSSAAVGVGASVGMNIAVNTTSAEIQQDVALTDANNVTLGATGDHTLDTEVTGGAAGAKISITPTAAVTLAVDTTTANLDSGTGLNIGGAYDAEASQTTAMTTVATGQTQGSNVAVGASVALTTAVDTVSATLAQNLAAGGAVTLKATNISGTSTSATASVAGGAPADSNGNATDGNGGTGKTVDQQVAAQGSAADTAGSAAGSDASSKLSANKQTAPSASSSDGAVSVAAAVGVNVDVATSTATIASGVTVQSGGELTVASTARMGAQATADGSQTGNTGVGVGAAVALNVGTLTNQAVIDDGSSVTAKGVSVSALMPSTGSTSDAFGASATSGAGATNVGVAGSLAVNVVVNTVAAQMDGQTTGTSVNAGGGDVQVEAANAATSTVSSGATVSGSGSNAKVGVGASVGVNVVVDTTTAEVGDGVALTGVDNLAITANAGYTLSTSVTGGASGASVNITPLASVAVDLNTTTASLGSSGTGLSLAGTLTDQATGTDTVTTTATGQTSGNVAVGASLAATVAMDHVNASIDRNVTASTGITLGAASTTALTTTASASAKGAASNSDSNGNPEPGTTPDDQKDTELTSAEGKNSGTSGLDLSKENDSTSATTPSTNSDASGGTTSGAKVSVAAAIGVGVAENQAVATTGAGLTLNTSGTLGVQATTDTNYATNATGLAVSDKTGIAAAVALTATLNETQAGLGVNNTVAQAGSINIAATSTQNLDPAFLTTQASVAVSGASGGNVAVAGALAVVANDNQTLADIGEGAQIGTGTPVGDIAVTANDTSRLSAAAVAGALSKGSSSEAGVGASFAVLLSDNQTTAEVGYGTVGTVSHIDANSLTVTATKDPVDFAVPFNIVTDPKNTQFLETLANPATYLSQVNDYTEAVAGAASQGTAAVAGSFSVNVFGNTTSAYLNNANVTTTGVAPGGNGLGVQVASQATTDAITVAGGVAIAKQAGVGISNADVVNSDQVLSAIEGSSNVTSAHSVQVAANASQDIVNVAISGGVGTSSTGVGGVLGVIVTMNQVEASIGDGSSVKSMGDVDVTAGNDTLSIMAAGGIGAGSSAGVGASIAANTISNVTTASIGKDATVDAAQTLTVSASAAETAVTGVVAGAGAGDVGVAGALSLDTILTDTEASIGLGAKINTDPAYSGNAAQAVAVTAQDTTTIVGVAGGLAGGGDVGVGAAADTAVLDKTVKAFVADDVDATDPAVVKANAQVAVGADSTDSIVSVTLGLAGGGDVGVGGAVSIAVVENHVDAYIGQSAEVTSGGNVLVTAQDDITAVLTAGGAAGGGDAGVGGSIAVATLLGHTLAWIGPDAQVTASGNGGGAPVYTADGTSTPLANGLAVTANTQENLITTVASGAGGGSAGVAATVSANVIASDTEATIDSGAQINPNNTGANPDQQVLVRAIDDTSLVNTAAGAGGGGAAGIGAAANVGVIAKTTIAEIQTGVQINAVQAVELTANSQEVSVSTTAGFAGGGSAGVGGSVAGVGVADTTKAIIDDGTSSTGATQVAVTGGDLDLHANDLATSTMITGSGAGGGAAGVGVSLAVAVNTSETLAKIGNYAETSAYGTTSVQANSLENLNTITVAGAGGGAAGVAGTISVEVLTSDTEAGIGQNAQVNQSGPASAGQSVNVQADSQIITVAAGGAGAGGGAAGVGGSANVTFAKNTTTAYVDNDAQVHAAQDVNVQATDFKSVNSATVAGAGGGAAGVAGAVSVIAVGSLLDDQANSGLNGGNTTSYADSQTTTGAVGTQMGTSAQDNQTAGVLASQSGNLAISGQMGSTTQIPHTNTQAYIGYGSTVTAGGNVALSASDSTLAIVAAGSGAGGGAAGVSGSFGVVLLHDSAEAFIADGANVDAKGQISVDATTGEQVYNVGITGAGAGAAAVDGVVVVNVISSDTEAYVGAANLNQNAAYQTPNQSVSVNADSSSILLTLAAAGGGAGAATVGGVLNTNVLTKDTEAFIADGANVSAQANVAVAAASTEDVISGGVFIGGAGAAAVSGVAAANIVDDTTQAYIGASRQDAAVSGAVVDSQGNVTLSATDSTLIVAASAVGNGAGAAAVGGNVGANVIDNDTEAYISDLSTVNARGHAAGVSVYDGGVGSTSSLPAVPGGGSGQVNVSGSNSDDANLSQGASVNLTTSSGGTQNTNQGMSGLTSSSGTGGLDAPSSASGGLDALTQASGFQGLSLSAVSQEKIIPVTISVAGAGAAGITGSASANVVATKTEATIGDKVQVNTGTAGAAAVQLTAADNTLLVQTAGTISGAGAAAVSGAVNVGIVEKTTLAQIGDAKLANGDQTVVNASDLTVQASSGEQVYTIGANLSVAGAAGVGGAVGVDYIQNQTTADLGPGTTVTATGNLSVKADEDSAINIYTLSGAGGIVGVSGALSVGIIDNTTEAYVASSQTAPTTLNARGTTDVAANSQEDLQTVTVSGAGGGVGVAGAVAVKLVTSTTEAYLGPDAQVNQNPALSGPGQNVEVNATDTVGLTGGGGAASIAGFAAGATAEINIVRNTTAAYLGSGSDVSAGQDVDVAASSTKSIQSAAAAASGGFAAGIGGAVTLAFVGSALDTASQSSISSGNNSTASSTDSQIATDNVSGQLGNSQAVQGVKSQVSSGTAGLNVDAINSTSTVSSNATQASIDSGAQVTAGRNIGVSAQDATQINLVATGAGGGIVGVGGAFATAVTDSTTKATIDSAAQISAGGDVTVQAGADSGSGSSVKSFAGSGGVYGASASVAVLTDASLTQAYLGSGVDVTQAAALTVEANTDRQADAQAYGASVGGLAVGASVATATFAGETDAFIQGDKTHPLTVQDTATSLSVEASDASSATTMALAGSAGIVSGSGSAATSVVQSTVNAYLGPDANVSTTGDVNISAMGQAATLAQAYGVSAGSVAVGVSLAIADTRPQVSAYVGAGSTVNAADLTVAASMELPAQALNGASGPYSAEADTTSASGGLVGINGASATATNEAATTSYIDTNSTINVNGSTQVTATDSTSQYASALGVAAGLAGIGADVAVAQSTSATTALLGNNATVKGGSLSVTATGTDAASAYSLAGSLGIISGSGSAAAATVGSGASASLGTGTDVTTTGDVNVAAAETASTLAKAVGVSAGAAAVGVSIAIALNNPTVTASVGANSTVTAQDLNVTATQSMPAGGYSAEAESTSASGGLLGINGASSTAENTGTTTSYIDTGSTINVTGTVGVTANETTSQYASSTGVVAGILAVGADLSLAESNTTTLAYLNGQVAVSGTTLALTASGQDTNVAYALSGSGGVVAGSAATVTTSSTSDTEAYTSAGTSTQMINVTNLDIQASHDAVFNGEVDSTNAAIAGMSAANAINTVNSTVVAQIGASGEVYANNIAIAAANTVDKDWLLTPAEISQAQADAGNGNAPDYAGVADWNVNSGSGGLVNVPAGSSVTTITATTTAAVGANANVAVGVTLLPDAAPALGTFTMDARNTIIAHDKVELDSGGAIAFAEAQSSVTVNATATASFGGGSSVDVRQGDIDAGAMATVDINTLADADTYGLAGAPAGQAYSFYTGTNQVLVGSLATLMAETGGINLYGGDSSSGAPTTINAVSAVNLWNKTAIPIATTPDAETNVSNNPSVVIQGPTVTFTSGDVVVPGTGTALMSAGDINLAADRGSVSATATGIGKNIYLEALAEAASDISELFGGSSVSFDITGGSSNVTGTGVVQVNGTMATGIKRNVTLSLDGVLDGTDASGAPLWYLVTSTGSTLAIDLSKDVQYGIGIGQSIYSRISYLQNLANQYAGTAAGDAYNAEIAFLTQELLNQGLAAYVNGNLVLGTGATAGISPQQAAQTQANAVQLQATTVNASYNTANTTATAAQSTYTSAKAVSDSESSAQTYVQARSTDIQTWITTYSNSNATPAQIAAAQQQVVNDETSAKQADPKVTFTTPTPAPPANPTMANLPVPTTQMVTNATSDYNAYHATYLTNLTTTSTDYSTWQTDATTASTLYTQYSGLNTAYQNLETYIANLGNAPAPAGPTNNIVTVPVINAQLGSIHVKGDVLQGSGELLAPGDAHVDIINNTPDSLVIQDITVDTNAAQVTMNGSPVNTNADITGKNLGHVAANFGNIVTGATGAAPEVTIESLYNPLNQTIQYNAPAPELTLTGTITNTRGPVTVLSNAGSVYSQGSILGGTVSITAANGDFVQSYVDGFDSIGGDPATIYNNSVNGNPTPGGGITANGSILISARYLNINGTIQSGICDYDLTLPTLSNLLFTGTPTLLGVDPSAVTKYQLAYEYQTTPGSVPATTTFLSNDGQQVNYNAVTQQLTVNLAWVQADLQTAAGKSNNPQGLYPVVLSSNNNIGVAYDAINNQYSIAGTEVNGGSITLFGQILNTANGTSSIGSGNLNVLDGYGRINITNPTNIPVVLNTLDTGTGVAGTINITDIQSINPTTEAVNAINSVITRNANGVITDQQQTIVTTPATATSPATVTYGPMLNIGDSGVVTSLNATNSTQATYHPQAGLAYVYSTGFNSSTETFYSYSGTQFFGSSSLRLAGQTTPIGSLVAGPYQLTDQQMAAGNYLATVANNNNPNPNPSNYFYTTGPVTTPTAPPVYTVTDSYTKANWWDLDITQTYYIDYNIVQANQTITANVIKADNPININFLGYSNGSVNVKSAANVILDGPILNKNGTTTIVAGNSGTGVTNADTSIVQGTANAQITTTNLNLTASGSIGTAAAPVRISAAGTVNAAAADGNVELQGVISNINVGTITAGSTQSGGPDLDHGQVVLAADQSISGTSSSLLQGYGIDLTAGNGSIGATTPDGTLNIQVGYTDDLAGRLVQGLQAQATGNIGIQSQAWAGNPNADLLINTVVATGGNVLLATPGRIINNNPNQTINTQTYNALVDAWDSVGLVAGSAQNIAQQNQVITAYNNSMTQNYQTYWQIRNLQANPAVYNPSFVYVSSAAEAATLTAQGFNVATFDANKTAEYHTLNTEVGALTTSYVPGYSYQASAAEQAQLLSGSSWTPAQLALSITPGLLKDITNTNPVVQAPNVSGNIVTLQAGTAIGETQAPVVIQIPAHFDPSTLTSTQKEALAAAEVNDVVYTTSMDNGVLVPTINIYPRSPVVFAATTAINATVAAAALAAAQSDPSPANDAGNLFLASPGDALLGTITAQGDARIKVLGSIINAPTGSDINTGDLVLEAANGGIGYLQGNGTTGAVEALTLSPTSSSATLTARAMDNIDIYQGSGDISVYTIYSRQGLQLTANGGSILNAFGTSDLNLSSNTMELFAPNGSIGTAANPLNVAVNTTGGFTAVAGQGGAYLNVPSGYSLVVDGITSSGAVQLDSYADLTLDGTVAAPGQIGLVAGGTLTMNPGSLVHDTASAVLVNAGTLDMMDNGTQAAGILADLGPIAITTEGNATITGIVSGNNTASAVTITSTQGAILPGHLSGSGRLDITASQPNAQVTLSAAQGIGDDPLDLNAPTLQATTGGVAELNETGAVNVLGISAGGQVTLTAGGSVNGGAMTTTAGGVGVTATAGSIDLTGISGTGISLSAPGSVTGTNLAGGAGPVSATSTGSTVSVSKVTGGAITLSGQGTVAGDTVSGTSINATSASGDVTLSNASGTGEVSLTAPGNASGTNLSGNVISLSGQAGASGQSLTGTGAQSQVTITSSGGTVNASQVTATTIGLNGQGNVTGDTLSGTGITATSTGGDVDLSNVTGNTVSLSAPGTVTGDGLNVGSNLQLAGSQISGSVTGGSQVVGGSITGFGGGSADSVNLTLSTPSGFAFSSFWCQTAAVNLPSGWLSSDNTLVADRATFTSPATFMIVDQLDRSMQDCDVQLYPQGAAFSFLMTGNKVFTDAFVIYRGPMYEAIAPTGEDRGGTEQAEDALDRTTTDPLLSKTLSEPEAAGTPVRTPLISYSGFPVSTEEE